MAGPRAFSDSHSGSRERDDNDEGGKRDAVPGEEPIASRADEADQCRYRDQAEHGRRRETDYEKLAASSRLIPTIRAVVIVEPARETPGMIARA